MPEVETTSDGSVLTITLNRPDVLNAFNKAMHGALGAALKEARDPDVRATRFPYWVRRGYVEEFITW